MGLALGEGGGVHRDYRCTPMGRIEDRLSELGLELPRVFAPPPGLEFRFDLVRVHRDLAFVSGHLPMDGPDVLVTGEVGSELTVEQGYEAARLTTLSILASLRGTLGDLDRVAGWVRALGLVRCAPGFDKPPAVINGFTDLVLELWGDAGHHARTAIGAGQLPFGAPVEIEAIVELT
jgi:enamine deaminase RidA (YjgF/YER057c/UK114 family)